MSQFDLLPHPDRRSIRHVLACKVYDLSSDPVVCTVLWRAQVEARLNVGDGEEANAVVSLAEDVYGPFSGQACARPEPLLTAHGL